MDRKRKPHNKASRKSFYLTSAIYLVAILFVGSILFFSFEDKTETLEAARSYLKGSLHLKSPPPASTTSTPMGHESNLIPSVSHLANPKQNSKFAYVTLIAGIDRKLTYRGFLFNVLIMRKALLSFGSTADFIALIGYSEKDTTPFQGDMDLLRSYGIIVHELPRLVDEQHPLSFAEMALLKITPWSFTQYEKLQFFDGDVMPNRNMDCFFQLQHNSFTVGAVSPLNSGWYLAKPSMAHFQDMRAKAVWRLGRDWDPINGWAEPIPESLRYRGGRPCEQWRFNGADMDQGLLTHYFVMHHGDALLVDTELRTAKTFTAGLLEKEPQASTSREALDCCGGAVPTAFFTHFTGRSKPWMNKDLDAAIEGKGNGDLYRWKMSLNSLNVDVNSSNIGNYRLGSSLGFFNANFPKGGFKTKE